MELLVVRLSVQWLAHKTDKVPVSWSKHWFPRLKTVCQSIEPRSPVHVKLKHVQPMHTRYKNALMSTKPQAHAQSMQTLDSLQCAASSVHDGHSKFRRNTALHA